MTEIYITIEQTYNTCTSKLKVGFEPLHFEEKKNAVLPKPTGWAGFQCSDSLGHKDTN